MVATVMALFVKGCLLSHVAVRPAAVGRARALAPRGLPNALAGGEGFPETPPGNPGFFDLYAEEELAELLRVHQDLFPEAEAEIGAAEAAAESKPSFSLHDAVLRTLEEADEAALEED
mmetsp:Transcript_8754/g.24150  ORF Transcript_8754/g.24150 Transcript_8754/m.24150 type:complete len:118 (+) Transcript_8754:36-389(+)